MSDINPYTNQREDTDYLAPKKRDWRKDPKLNGKAAALKNKKRIALIKRPMSDIHKRGFKSTESFEPGNENNK